MSHSENPLVQLFLVRYREFRREPGVLFWVFGFPLLLALCLGLAFRERGPEVQPVAVVEGAGAAEAAAAVNDVEGLEATVFPEDESRRRLSTGAAIVVLFPGAEPRVMLDPMRPGSHLTEVAVRHALERARRGDDMLQIRQETETAPGRRYIDFLLPGLLGMQLLSGGVWGVGWAIVQLRTRKLLKRFAATPMRRSDFLLSFVAYRVILAIAEVLVLGAFGWLVFDMQCHGNVLEVFVLVLFSALCFSGVGLLVGSRAQNPQSAGGLINLVTLPMFVMSGVFFSAENFPGWLQPLIQVLPLTAFNDGLRAIVNDGASFGAYLHEPLLLLGWGALTFLAALRIFRWT